MAKELQIRKNTVVSVVRKLGSGALERLEIPRKIDTENLKSKRGPLRSRHSGVAPWI